MVKLILAAVIAGGWAIVFVGLVVIVIAGLLFKVLVGIGYLTRSKEKKNAMNISLTNLSMK